MEHRGTAPPIHQVVITARESLTPHMVRLTLSGPDLQGMRARPAQDIELLLGPEHGRRVKRRYTIRQLRPEAGELDVDVLLHSSGGPGSSWAAHAATGDDADFIGPKGKLQLLDADWHLFVGDEASLPAIAALTETLGSGATTVVLCEVGGPEDELSVEAAHLHWLHRADASPGTTDLLARALDELRVPAGSGRAYLLGESHVVNTLRGRISRLGIPADRSFVKGYWSRPQRADSVLSATIGALRGIGGGDR
jgi:NADPH-dependent ferric siderophore reductase